MNRKTYWGIAALIVILIAAGGFIFYQLVTVQQMKEELAQDKKILEEREKLIAENNLPPAEPGKKWVPHGDHFHEVPIEAPDVWQGEPHEPVAQEESVSHPTQATHPVSNYKGTLTYHAELLETNPVEALRMQGKELNHWSTDYIPDYPPDDVAAHDFARVEYLKRYIKVTGEVPPGINQAQLDRSFDEGMDELHRRLEAREPRFRELTWVMMDPPSRWDDGTPVWDY